MATHGKRRALGQHFLKDTSIAAQIAEAAVNGARQYGCKTLLEIGPGRGAITFPILERISKDQGCERVLLVEKDRDLAQEWKTRSLMTFPVPLVVESADFLELPEAQWLMLQPIAVASNLPYSSGTAILTRLAACTTEIRFLVLMFQAEVAKRLRAGPSSSGRGSLSVWIQNHWDVQSLVKVPPGAFSPPPDVNSEVVVLTRRENPWIDTASTAVRSRTWDALLRACFAHRRKMLRSTFPWPQALQHSGIDPTLRAEALDWAEWDKLFHSLLSLGAVS
jgi:16S rRNA (adenine1518-N6/adenine1519-N6)-dimethyltransferase